MTTTADIARYEDNIAEAEKAYQDLLAKVRSLPRSTQHMQLDRLVDDLNHAQYTRTFYQERLEQARTSLYHEGVEQARARIAAAQEHPTFRTICIFTAQEQMLRVIQHRASGDYDIEMHTTDGWQSYNMMQMSTYYLLQLLGPWLRQNA